MASRNFGPTASLCDSSNLQQSVCKVVWRDSIRAVLVLKKSSNKAVDDAFVELLTWMSGIRNLKIYVEAEFLPECLDKLPCIANELFALKKGKKDERDQIELIVTVGGDGTLLHGSKLFENSMPPLFAFRMGTLGFLTPFEFKDFPQLLTDVLKGRETCVSVRSRLSCSLIKDHEMPSSSTVNHTVLNEIVLKHGKAGSLCAFELIIEEKLVAVVHADGLIIATPTGSSAYAASAGGPLVHPDAAVCVIVAISPHSLCWRPLIIPAHHRIKVCLANSSRHKAWVTFDGKNCTKFKISDVLEISASDHPFPLLCRSDGASDWFRDLSTCLRWNVRDVVNDYASSSSSSTS